VFVFAGLAMVVLALGAFLTKSYRMLSKEYQGQAEPVPAEAVSEGR
jgi:DHA3 family multidrug efflux protein-like MFS transporter